MAILFGKFSDKFPAQIENGFYETDRHEMFGSLEVGDLVYAIGGGRIQLWKAKKWTSNGDFKKMEFEIISNNLEINTNEFIAFDRFVLSKTLIIYTMRQGKKAFFEIKTNQGFQESDLLDLESYKKRQNYRSIRCFESYEQLEDSRDHKHIDITLYKKENIWKILYPDFAENDVFKDFNDNTKFIGKGRRFKDSTLRKIFESNLPNVFESNIISIRSFYDAFCVNYNSKKTITDRSNKISETMKKDIKVALNQILYGPPGTGKTYNTLNRSIEIVDPNYVFENKSRKDISEHFRSLLYDEKQNPNGQIVFTTFHQSMAYEDFIEGIKPTVDDTADDDQNTETNISSSVIEYVVKDGIFKEVVELAKKSTKNALEFDQLWLSYLSLLRKNLDEKIFTSVSSELKLENVEPHGNSINVRFKKSWNPEEPEGTRAFIVSKNMIERLFDAKIDGSESNKKGRSDVAKLVGSGRATHIYSVYKDFYEFAFNKGAFTSGERLNYVIVIDEINRGNLSSIFGELITLIEPDKRIGEVNELSVVLPYSRDKFSIPPNLYIIGTMNTADRSVEALDTALRRRFSFVEMLPDPNKLENKEIEGVNLTNLLFTLNKRIEVLVDRDHTIGHAFFLNNENLDDLRSTFANKIIPLLQEYFYGDYSKMEMVIGSAFFEVKEVSEIKFAVRSDEFDPEGKIYHIKNISDPTIMSDEEFIEALNQLIKGHA